jgi:7-carboxy-7-deazaguanine synthase
VSSATAPLTKRWPVVEIFGPTIQGEGVDQGVVAHFVRFGGCDYRCDWCDTPHAVLPAEVRQAERLTAGSILSRLHDLEDEHAIQAPWVIITGGNPALHDLTDLVAALQDSGYLVAVETQGSRWRDWMHEVDRLCVSPKPPSSLEPKARDLTALQRFLHEALEAKRTGEKPYEWMFLKVVVFDDDDLDYAVLMRSQMSDALLYLSAGNDAGRTVGSPERRDERTRSDVRNDLADRALWLTNEVFTRPELCVPDVIVQMQQHVMLWGNELGR